ncbi:MAG: hypothetical protein R3B13_12730 [Polyangiaceae bacterium]
MRISLPALLLGTGLWIVACSAPGYGAKGGSKSAKEKPAAQKSGGEQKEEGDEEEVAPPPDLPDYAPLE